RETLFTPSRMAKDSAAIAAEFCRLNAFTETRAACVGGAHIARSVRMDGTRSGHGKTASTSMRNSDSVAPPMLSIRDWFAGMAMQGAIASEPVGNDTVTPGGLAAWSYRIADAMLAERE